MNILYVTRKFPPSIGGMQTQSYQFYNAISRNNRVYLISWGHSQLFLPIFFIMAALRSFFILAFRPVDVIQLGDTVLSPLGLMLKKVFQKPTFTVSHGRDSAYDNFLYNSFVLESAKRLDRVICVSSYLREALIARGMPGEKTSVVPNGIDTGRLISLSEESQKNVKELEKALKVELKDKKIILSVSRLVPKKGIEQFVMDILPRILKKMDNLIFIIVGDGPEKQRIEEKAKELCLEDKVCFTGKIKNGSTVYNSLFDVADIFVMPNIKTKGDAEGFGLVSLEAALKKLPVIAFDVDGISEAIKNTVNGLLVKRGDNKMFAKQVLSFLEERKLKDEFGKRAKSYVVEHFDWKNIIGRYEKEYLSVKP